MTIRIIPLEEGKYRVQEAVYDNFFVARSEARKIVRDYRNRESGATPDLIGGSGTLSSVIRELRYDRILETR